MSLIPEKERNEMIDKNEEIFTDCVSIEVMKLSFYGAALAASAYGLYKLFP